jgi:hypothetical protein
VQDRTNHGRRAQTQSRVAREPFTTNQRFAYSPKEFGEANGRSATWGYRQVYAGKVKVISDCGRLLIPYSEVERFLARASEYNPAQSPPLQRGVEPGTPTHAEEGGYAGTRMLSDKTAGPHSGRVVTVSTHGKREATTGDAR